MPAVPLASPSPSKTRAVPPLVVHSTRLTSPDRSTAATGNRRRRPALDGVRGLAVLAVVIYHFGGGATSWLPGGFLGVDVFFVLSGYLITSLLLEEHARSGRIGLAAFWARRARRLLPALALVLVAVSAWVWWVAPVNDYPRRRMDAFWSLGQLANWHFADVGEDYFASYGHASPLRHMWSLAVEEQFYLLWPAIVLGLLAAGRRRRLGARWTGPRLVGAVAVTGIAVSAAAMAAQWEPGNPSRAYYGTDGRVQELFVGVLLALLLAGRFRSGGPLPGATSPSPTRPRLDETSSGVPDPTPTPLRPPPLGLPLLAPAGLAPAGLALAGLGVLVAGLLWMSDADALYYGGGALGVSVATALLIAGIERHPAGGLARALSWRPAVALGRVSYGVYLWHWPVAVALPVPPDVAGISELRTQALRVVLTLALSLASYGLVEQPALRSHSLRRSPRRVAVVSAAVVAAVAAGIVWATSLPGQMYDQVAISSDRPCAGETVERLVACVRPGGRGSPAQAPSFMVAGDSVARGLAPGLDTWARRSGTAWVQAAWKECSATGVMTVRTVDPGPNARVRACHEQARDRILEALDRYRPTTVLVSEFSPHYKPLLVGGRRVRPGTLEHADVLSAAYTRLVDDVAAHGARVVFVELPPPADSVASVVAADRMAGRTPGTAPGGEYVEGYNAVLRQVAGARPGRAEVVSVTDAMCPPGSRVGDRCGPVLDGMITRVDGVHLSPQFSEVIAPVLVARAGLR